MLEACSRGGRLRCFVVARPSGSCGDQGARRAVTRVSVQRGEHFDPGAQPELAAEIDALVNQATAILRPGVPFDEAMRVLSYGDEELAAWLDQHNSLP